MSSSSAEPGCGGVNASRSTPWKCDLYEYAVNRSCVMYIYDVFLSLPGNTRTVPV